MKNIKKFIADKTLMLESTGYRPSSFFDTWQDYICYIDQAELNLEEISWYLKYYTADVKRKLKTEIADFKKQYDLSSLKKFTHSLRKEEKERKESWKGLKIKKAKRISKMFSAQEEFKFAQRAWEVLCELEKNLAILNKDMCSKLFLEKIIKEFHRDFFPIGFFSMEALRTRLYVLEEKSKTLINLTGIVALMEDYLDFNELTTSLLNKNEKRLYVGGLTYSVAAYEYDGNLKLSKVERTKSFLVDIAKNDKRAWLDLDVLVYDDEYYNISKEYEEAKNAKHEKEVLNDLTETFRKKRPELEARFFAGLQEIKAKLKVKNVQINHSVYLD